MSFSKVAVRKPQVSRFSMTHSKKFSTDPGRLTPVMVTDVLPGDIWKIRHEALVRFAPMVAPVMHEASCSFYSFFVPNRILSDNWEKFISPETIDQIPVSIEQFLNTDVTVEKSSIADYVGIPTGQAIDFKEDVSTLPFAAIGKIYNEYFRDENLANKVPESCSELANVDGERMFVSKDENLLVAWPHDYFTSALPFAQKGQPVSIGALDFGDVPVYTDSIAPGTMAPAIYRPASPVGDWEADSDVAIEPVPTDASKGYFTGKVEGLTGYYASSFDAEESYLKARTSDLTASSSITVNDLRVAIKTQEFLERQARGGSRYTENLRIQWGVISSDARLQRPEFIGMSHGPVQISEVLQTSETTESSPLATMSGHGISAGRTKTFRYRAEEHGWLISFMVVRPVTAYQQGVQRMFSRKSLFDYAVPILANIGEQEVLNKELYYDKSDGENNDTFGYLPRYEEYRYIPSTVAGDFRDNLAYWHWGRIFEERPTLSQQFLACQPSNRIFAVEGDVDHLWCYVKNDVTAVRKLPRFGTPLL